MSSIRQSISSLSGVVLCRDSMDVRADTAIRLPRFHLLGLLWSVVELAIFIVTLVKTDFSFESSDLTSQMLKSAINNDFHEANLTKEAPQSLGSLEGGSLLAMTVGSLQANSEHCGPAVGSPYFIYTSIQALLAIAHTTEWNWDFPGVTKQSAASATSLSSLAAVDVDHPSITTINYRVLDLLLCNRTEPLLDQRYSVSGVRQSCKAPAVHLNASLTIDLCNHKEDFVFRLQVAGVKSTCLFSFQRRDPLSPGSFAFCIRFGRHDLDRPDMQWLIRRLRTAWNRIVISAYIWILSSVVMRILYWRTLVKVTQRSLWHLRYECTDKPRCNGTPIVKMKVSRESNASKVVPGPTSASSRSKTSLRKATLSGTSFHDFLTAASIGVASANNDWWYLGLSIVRQVLGAPYGELMTVSSVTVPLAAWQAFGIVVYHQAVIQLFFLSCGQLFDRRGPTLPIIRDVGVLGYTSLIYLAVVVQLNQLYNYDLGYLCTAITRVVASCWWLVLPACGPDEPCLYIRGDIIAHLLAAIYVSIGALLIQMFVRGKLTPFNLLRRRSKMSVQDVDKRPSEKETFSKAVANNKPLRSSRSNKGHTSWNPLGTVGCPRCGYCLVEQTTLLSLTLATSSTSIASSLIKDVGEPTAKKQEVTHFVASEQNGHMTKEDGPPRDSPGSCAQPHRNCFLIYSCSPSNDACSAGGGIALPRQGQEEDKKTMLCSHRFVSPALLEFHTQSIRGVRPGLSS